MRRSITTAAAVLAVAAIAGCSSSQPAAAEHTNSSTLNTPKQQPATPSVHLAWSHTGTFFDEPQVWYVARVKNPGSSAASVALDASALDKSGTIVGSSQDTLPNIPAGTTFDYFGYLGGGGAFSTKLTGTPAKINISQVKDAFGKAGAVDQPMLKTSEIKLSKGSKDDLAASVPYSYNLSVKVTNSTKDTVTGGVTQQVVLYDKAGHVVGGDSGSSDNAPDSLPASASYREQWTGIPALHPAVRAVYTVWPG